MTGERSTEALTRIEAALARIEVAAARAPASDTSAPRPESPLRSEIVAALADIDRLIAQAEAANG